jgi:metallo-beta-lactamase class B
MQMPPWVVARLALCALLAVGAIAGASAADAAGFAATRAAWNLPAEPFRVIDNVYYVGTDELGAWLIRTDEGLILLDGALEESAPLIEASIRRLGFRVEDIRILLSSHAHFDHSGGLAKLKGDSGARMIASRGDRISLESGTYFGNESMRALDAPPVRVDEVIEDGGVVTLGGTTLTAHVTPGHTRGCTTWTMRVVEGGVGHTAIFYCSTSVALNRLWPDPQYPGIVEDYRRSFDRLEAMKADVFLANHQDFFGLWKKRAAMHDGAPNPFVDPTELQRFVAGSRAEFELDFATQQRAGQGAKP